MSSFDDDEDEMTRHRLITDQDADAILAGDPPHADFTDLASFVVEVRNVAADTVVTASPALQAMWATGISIESGPAGQAPATSNRRNRMSVPQFIAGLSLAGKIALGAGLAAATAATGALTGTLPGPVQHVVSVAVHDATPFEVPDNPGRHLGHPDDETTTSADGTTTTSADETTTTESDETTTTESSTSSAPNSSEPKGPDATGPAAFGLCAAWTHGAPKNVDNPAFGALKTAATDAGMTIDAYCQVVLANKPGNSGPGRPPVAATPVPAAPGPPTQHPGLP